MPSGSADMERTSGSSPAGFDQPPRSFTWSNEGTDSSVPPRRRNKCAPAPPTNIPVSVGSRQRAAPSEVVAIFCHPSLSAFRHTSRLSTIAQLSASVRTSDRTSRPANSTLRGSPATWRPSDVPTRILGFTTTHPSLPHCRSPFRAARDVSPLNRRPVLHALTYTGIIARSRREQSLLTIPFPEAGKARRLARSVDLAVAVEKDLGASREASGPPSPDRES